MDTATFERDRLALFARHGFAGESRWLEDASGKKTYAVVRKGGPRTTLVVHGGLADASVWAQMAGHLPASATVVIPDRPGHGLSSPVDYAGVDYRRAAAEWMLSVVDALGVREVDLVGSSMGGYFCLVFALAHPERVRRIVLIGAPAGLDRELPLFLRLWGTPLVGRAVSKVVATTKDPETMRSRIFASLVTHPERISEDELRIAATSMTKEGWHVMARSMLHAVSDLGGWRPALSIREDIVALAVPTLFAWGDRDSFAPPSSGEDVARRMASASVEILADSGHLPQLDAPAASAAAIARFFADADEVVNGDAGDTRGREARS